jgi:hypothetical protein
MRREGRKFTSFLVKGARSPDAELVTVSLDSFEETLFRLIVAGESAALRNNGSCSANPKGNPRILNL